MQHLRHPVDCWQVKLRGLSWKLGIPGIGSFRRCGWSLSPAYLPCLLRAGLVACCWSRESSEFILNTETKTYKNIISQNRLSSCVQGAEVGGGDVHSVHGVHPSRGQTHSCRFKEVAACMQHADMLSFIVLKCFKVDSTSHAGSGGRLHQMRIPLDE